MGPWLIDVRTPEELTAWLGERRPQPGARVVMVVRGDGAEVREFLPNALDAAKRDEGRLVVWVQDPDLMTLDRVEDLFRDDDEILAAVVTANHRIAGWVFRDRIGVDDAEFAFRQAG